MPKQSEIGAIQGRTKKNMDHLVRSKIVNFIWSVANDCYRDILVFDKYRDVIGYKLVGRAM